MTKTTKTQGFPRQYHDHLRDHAKLIEERKPVFVGGVLLALTDPAFRNSYRNYKGETTELARYAVETITAVLEKRINSEEKIKTLLHAFDFIQVHPIFVDQKNNILLELINSLDKNIHQDNTDLLSEFYKEFIRYSGGDGKGLGIVLTPTHICGLFASLANLNKDSKILDICTGTGAFLLAGLHEVKGLGLVGVEQQANMFALSCTNMILHECNSDNLYFGSCFDLKEALKTHKCNVGFVNPPYSQKGDGLHELDFVECMMDCLIADSLGFAIVPMSCALQLHPIRERLLEKHTLVGVMSMPEDLFYPVKAGPCIMVFKAHVPHDQETWFADWKDDGHIKLKKEGKADYHGRWPTIKTTWVNAFLNQTEVPGKSVRHRVTVQNEWCCEAYVSTDYSNLSRNDFASSVRDYAAFLISSSKCEEDLLLDTSGWKKFGLSSLFELKKGKRVTKKDTVPGEIPWVTSIADNNGVTDYIGVVPGLELHEGNTITVNCDGCVGEAFYQGEEYYALDSVSVLYPKFKINRHIGLFIITLIRQEQFKYNYGRKWHLERMRDTEIMLPVTEEGKPDFEFMEGFVKNLAYSNHIVHRCDI